LQVEVIENSAAACSVRFSVRDTGIGMPADVVRRLFTAFMQAHDSTSRRYGGSGLGLAICQQLAQLMRSEIKVSSHPGFGSTFSFELQLMKTSAPKCITADCLSSSCTLVQLPGK